MPTTEVIYGPKDTKHNITPSSTSFTQPPTKIGRTLMTTNKSKETTLFKSIILALTLTVASCGRTAPVTAAPSEGKCAVIANLLMVVANNREANSPIDAFKALVMAGLSQEAALTVVNLVYVQKLDSTPEEIGLDFMKHCMSEPA